MSDAPRQDRPATRRIREQPYMVKQIGALVPCSLVLWDCEGLGIVTVTVVLVTKK